MTDRIDREAAVRRIEARAYEAENTHSPAVAYGMRLAGDVVRALPAVSAPTREAGQRCETCAAWREYRHTPGHGRCDVCRFSAASFFCAAWEAKEGAR